MNEHEATDYLARLRRQAVKFREVRKARREARQQEINDLYDLWLLEQHDE